jgi:hypothetical protein
MAVSANSRRIPFALRAPVREQIQTISKDGTIESIFRIRQPIDTTASRRKTHPHLR